ncbi:respiratory nitrate reductase subunit gamma [Alicyclobacillus sp.]|uniref:respiratory nitrate reductase subunit gamma n=1 Tax=Alicyclobacillus sp. TaxID=61169 RepID=UPI0025BFBC1F|nr:respiratory nitrate reductase subunit gamma [Alicyclobacillus sp.]MCL6517047.1 respiratory nitrate reductase subunit gamma [Alicyclobacillus sp.]
MAQFWWVIFPYAALAVCIVGTLYRFVYGQRGWGSKSSEILEKRWLRVGSLLFHWGILFVIGGHVMGLLVPLSVYEALGVSSEAYHLLADVAGGLAGLSATAGCLILLLRRIFNKRVRRNSTVSDFVALTLLFLVIALGTAQTVVYNNVVGPYEYRLTVGPWTRGLILLHPDPALMAGVPLALKIHVVLTFLLFAVSPFTRLVHVWSAPLRYPTRAPIQYRARWGRFVSDARFHPNVPDAPPSHHLGGEGGRIVGWDHRTGHDEAAVAKERLVQKVR